MSSVFFSYVSPDSCTVWPEVVSAVVAADPAAMPEALPSEEAVGCEENAKAAARRHRTTNAAATTTPSRLEKPILLFCVLTFTFNAHK